MPQDDYLDRLLALAPLLRPGRVSVATVVHADDCGLWTGGACTCTPEITLRALRDPGERGD
ncbi:MAG: hypothetical protein ACRDHY_06295 [Anaerolineales bacterium]